MKFILIFILLGLIGCDSTEKTEAEQEDRETVFDPLVESLDKAREVEDIVMQQKRDMDAALEQMEGETDDPEE